MYLPRVVRTFHLLLLTDKEMSEIFSHKDVFFVRCFKGRGLPCACYRHSQSLYHPTGNMLSTKVTKNIFFIFELNGLFFFFFFYTYLECHYWNLISNSQCMHEG